MNILAQVLGALAIIVWVISIQQKNKKNLLFCQAIANGLYALQYVSLNAFTAASMNSISVIRSIIFYNNEKAHKRLSKLSLFTFCFLIIISGIINYNEFISLIPIFITLSYTYSVWQNNLKITRYVFLIAAFIWIYYNIQIGAYISVIGNILEIVSGITAIIRFRKN